MRSLPLLLDWIVIRAEEDERASPTRQGREIVAAGEGEHKCDFIRTATNEESLGKVLGSGPEARKIGSLQMIARRLGCFEQPCDLGADGFVAPVVRVVEQHSSRLAFAIVKNCPSVLPP